jgi:copper transport protein
VLFLKASLFAALLGLAAINRFRLTPALERQDAQKARWALLRTIAGETVLGLMALSRGCMPNIPPPPRAQR